VVDPRTDARRERYAQRLYELRCRKGVALNEAYELITRPNYFAAIMVELGDADGMIAGLGSIILRGCARSCRSSRPVPTARRSPGRI
jgi:malate dehydrogenase (oxaloacetate-decarboxylating)(NADP+)